MTSLQPDVSAANRSAAPDQLPGTYSHVTVHQTDTVGAVFLGLIALALLIAFMRSEARHRRALAQIAARQAPALPATGVAVP